jgi:hypothetical protein
MQVSVLIFVLMIFGNILKTWFAATSDKVYQLLAHGRWFSPGTPTSSTTKTGRHDIAEILLKVALNTKNQFKSKNFVMKRVKTTYHLDKSVLIL